LRGASRVVAVEVDPRAAVRLRSNLARNRVEGVTVLEERATRLEPYVAAMDRLAGGAGAGPLVLKMDIEGDEEPLIENSADSVVQRFHHIVLEYHRGPDRCLTRLRALGYSLHWDPPLEHPNGDRCGLIWADRDTPAS
ncbi:MAG TPA: hypothetical protein VEY07_06475, partial [Thermoplasmata archaeon]|nr:hypothetical protein [Thermoplasmata archaeon]